MFFVSRSLALLILATAPAYAAGRPVTFTSADGTTLSAMVYEAAARPAPAVVLVHMLGRSKDDWVTVAEALEDVGITSLAIDLRGHGRSGGSGLDLPAMVGDVRASLSWLAAHPGVRPDALGLVGASLGANLVGAAATGSAVRAIAMVSPSLDYRGIRLDPVIIKKLEAVPMWLAASTEDPYALRTIRDLAADNPAREQRLSGVRAHGTRLLVEDSDLGRALVDWLRRSLIF